MSTGYPTAEAAVQAYVVARDHCDVPRLRSAFHPSARLQSVDGGGALQVLTQLSWWQRFGQQTECVPATNNEVKPIDREGPLALAEVVSSWPTHVFHDYLLVVEAAHGWRIVDQIFERLSPGQSISPLGTEEMAVRAVLQGKIDAHASYAPALLDLTHLPECRYHRVHLSGVDYTSVSLSEAAQDYAEHQDRGETDRESPWQILTVTGSGSVAAAKLDVVFQGARYIDHLLLLRSQSGWRIAAAAWGPPSGAQR